MACTIRQSLLWSIIIVYTVFCAYQWRRLSRFFGASTNGPLIVSVLDKQSHDDCHIPTSIYVSLEDLDSFLEPLDKTKQLIFYCTNYRCTASDYAAQQAKKKGFTRVAVYPGGVVEWYQRGLPVKGACKASYLSLPNPHIIDTESDLEISEKIPTVTYDDLVKMIPKAA